MSELAPITHEISSDNGGYGSPPGPTILWTLTQLQLILAEARWSIAPPPDMPVLGRLPPASCLGRIQRRTATGSVWMKACRVQLNQRRLPWRLRCCRVRPALGGRLPMTREVGHRNTDTTLGEPAGRHSRGRPRRAGQPTRGLHSCNITLRFLISL